ncbi:hypothetical protein BX666DRAFT_1959215 [Dichotomocladium elegans]|nr:hypothetical protein BX666DRAFT_1959215 [Dichotomocladium elegans]
MSQHPLDVHPSDSDRDQLSPSPPLSTDDECDDFVQTRSLNVSPIPDNIIRASSPFGRRYLKPINGIQTKGFARSAKRRSSVLTLGSIERLQNFYANKELKLNKLGIIGFKRDETLVEEPDDLDQLPTPLAPPPSWVGLDVETDLDVLLAECFRDIQSTLTHWAMVTGPREHPSSSSRGSSHGSTDQDEGFQILPLLDSVTKMINSVKNYMLQRQDLSDLAHQKVRHAALDLLGSLKNLETRFRVDQVNNSSEDVGEYTYHVSDFGMLEDERQAIHHYLTTVENFCFNPPHHIGSPPAVFPPEIRALLIRTAVCSESSENSVAEAPQHSPGAHAELPAWLQRRSFQNDALGRYHAFLQDNADPNEIIPDPHQDQQAFLIFLADGITLCNVYNNTVKRSRRPFGFITKIHQDTKRTYRAIENLRFFSAACSFRFDLTFEAFDPAEVARKTDKGLQSLEKAVAMFCERVIQEFREYADLASKRRTLPAQPPLHDDVAAYLEKKLSFRS